MQKADAEELVVVPFGAHMYAVRRAAEATELGALQAPTGPPRALTARLPRLASTDCVVYNIACSAEFDSPAHAGVFPVIRKGVAREVKHPRNSFLVNTVFGNAWFQVARTRCCCAMLCFCVCIRVLTRMCARSQDDSCTLQLRGLRALEHALAVSRVLHRGALRELRVERWGTDNFLGRHVQVAQGCLLEHSVRRVLGDTVCVMPRTEEVSNVILLQVPHAGRLLSRAAAAAGLAPEGCEACGGDDAEAGGDDVRAARVSVQITRAGHVKMRLSWAQPVVLHGALSSARLKRTATQVRALVRALTRVLRALC